MSLVFLCDEVGATVVVMFIVTTVVTAIVTIMTNRKRALISFRLLYNRGGGCFGIAFQ